jgi:hypothetical protein
MYARLPGGLAVLLPNVGRVICIEQHLAAREVAVLDARVGMVGRLVLPIVA